MHLGMDTVELNGEGFSMLVKQGDAGRQGQPVQFDLDCIARQCKAWSAC
jgi:phosphocarrier protein